MERFSELKKDLERLARFGLNIADAHSCLIFLPPAYLQRSTNSSQEASLILGAHHSLSTDIIESCRFSHDGGLIGWVAKHNRSIHVSPFEHDSRTLGIYTTDQELKSFIGIPINLPEISAQPSSRTGVIACDSKKSFAFSKLQGKLLEDLSQEVGNTIRLSLLASRAGNKAIHFDSFLESAYELGQQLGYLSIEVLRLRIKNFDDLEHTLGTARSAELTEQVQRLVHQALPPHFPHLSLPNGDIVIVLDTMMTSFIENKIRALCQHVAIEGNTVVFEFLKNAVRKQKDRTTRLEQLIVDTSPGAPRGFDSGRELDYEYRRA